MGLGIYLGYFVSQNSRGHVLGHVKDLGEDPTKIDQVRIYRTNAWYVSDWSIVFLTGKETPEAQEMKLGKSDNSFMSMIQTWLDCCVFPECWKAENLIWFLFIMFITCLPESGRTYVLRTLTEPNRHIDRKGEKFRDQEEYIKTSVLFLERTMSSPRVHIKCVSWFTFRTNN